MESEKKRAKRRSLEAGREMLARYKATLGNKSQDISQIGEPFDEEFLLNETGDQTVDQQTSELMDDVSCRDTTQSSISMSEGEGDGDIEGIAGRVAKLQEALQDREAVIQSLNAEIEHIGAEPSSPQSSQSQNSQDVITVYKSQLQEYEQAVAQRDDLIKELASSLQRALASRDACKEQLSSMNEMSQTSFDSSSSPEVKKRMKTLEETLEKQTELIKRLNVQLTHSSDLVREINTEKEAQMVELNEYKSRVNSLNQQLLDANRESIEMQKNYEIHYEKIKKDMDVILEKFATETASKDLKHEQELKEKDNEIMKLKQNYEEPYKTLFERYNTELPTLETKHAKELHVFQSQLSTYKKKIDSLKLELEENRLKSEQTMLSDINNLKRQLFQSHQDKELLHEQIKLHKVQIDDLTAQCVAATSVLNSKESIEKSLEEALINVESLKQENISLKSMYDDLSARYAAAQAIIENNQTQERSIANKMYDIEKSSLSRMSNVNASLLSEYNTTTYQTIDEIAIQHQIVKQKLDEKEVIEKKLLDKVSELEDLVNKVTKELEESNVEKKSYEKQLKDMKNMCDKLSSELQAAKDFNSNSNAIPFPSSIYFPTESSKDSEPSEVFDKIDSYKKQIEELQEELRSTNKKLKDALAKINEFQSESEQLKAGLLLAWEECKEFDDKLNHTLNVRDNKFNETENTSTNSTHLVNASNLNATLNDKLAIFLSKTSDKSIIEMPLLNLDEMKKKLDSIVLRSEEADKENQKLREENLLMLKMQSNLEQLTKSLDEINAEKALLIKEIASLTEKHKEELSLWKNESLLIEQRHSKEMEQLRRYFEQKCLQMEKQYSEDVYSQHSKKMSDDSEVDELTDDLYCGGGADQIIKVNENQVKDAQDQDQSSKILTVDQLCQTEWDINVENGELNELRAAYSHQLEEQVALAKVDIINALQEQIQALVAVETDSEENWPLELLELRNKFTNSSKRELEKLKEAHKVEISQLKEDNSRNLLRTIERYQEQITNLTFELDDFKEKFTQQNTINTYINDSDIIKERDNLRKACSALKSYIQEVVKYCVTCEEELNNTLISEIIKRQQNVPDEHSTKDNKQDNEKLISKINIKRVHFAPQPNQITTIINKDTNVLFNLIEEENTIALELRNELEKCLERMKIESAQVFGIKSTPGESMLDTLSKQILWTTKINEELSLKLEDSENTIERYQDESQKLKDKITELEEKLIAIDIAKKEIISEGYGERDDVIGEIILQEPSELREKARYAIVNNTDDSSYLLQLIEGLCRFIDELKEETRKEKEDLQQQIEAADKQLRGTRKFLEEQASEREIERDEAARVIQTLEEQLKERGRKKERDLRISSETPLSPESPSVTPLLQVSQIQTVENLETQNRELVLHISDLEEKKSTKENELKSAIDKIWELREIIVDLELQIQSKSEKEVELLNQIDQLKEFLDVQVKNQEELVQQINMNNQNGPMNDDIAHLQEELRKHIISTEHFNVNSTALKQMKTELRDLLTYLDKRIKDLELYHTCGSNLSISQPSEDVSIRDQIDAARGPSPDDSNSPPTLPLDLLLKLKDKILKLVRTEDVAFKRINDLDMQLSSLKAQNEELQAEQEILTQTTSEQLYQIESMRNRLEQQKQNAPYAQKQAISQLESQIHDANKKIQSIEQLVELKEAELRDIKSELDRANQLLKKQQENIANAVQVKNNKVQELKDRLEILEQEKKALESKLNTRAQQEIPQIIDSMLASKNNEIDLLKEQLSNKEKELEVYASQHNDHSQNINKQSPGEPKDSARTLSDALSLPLESDEPEAIRNTGQAIASYNISANVHGSTNDSKNLYEFSSTDFSNINKLDIHVPLLELESCPQSFGSPPGSSTARNNNSTLDANKTLSNRSKNLPKSPIATPNRIDSQQLSGINASNLRIEDLEAQLKTIQTQLQSKSATLSKRESELEVLKKSLNDLRTEYKDSMESLTNDNKFYKEQYESCKQSECKIKRDLIEIENYLKLKTAELEICKGKVQANENILTELQNENLTLKDDINKLRSENITYQSTREDKIKELNNLKEIIFGKDITIETIKTRNEEIENENKQLYEYKTKFEDCRKKLFEVQNEIKRLNDGINNRDETIRRLQDMARRLSLSSVSTINNNDKDQEILHLKEYIKEKEKIICQMSEDSKSLHRALETIQTKMKESGNVVELRKKLKDERMFNTELTEMVAKLKQELEFLKDESIRESIEGADIEDMVQRELNLSADLDRKILDAIESEPEELLTRKMEKHSCNSLTIKPVEQDLEKIMQQYTDIRKKLKQANKLNEELRQQKDELEIEQNILKSQIVEYENRIFQIKNDLDNETKKNIRLNEDLADNKSLIRNLEIHLRKEKSAMETSQLQDTELIEMLRIKLSSSLSAEEELRENFTTLRHKYKLLQTKYIELKEKFQFEKTTNTSISPVLSDTDPNDLTEQYEQISRELIEMRDSLKTSESEKNRYERQLEIKLDEQEQLLSKIALLEGEKEHLEVDLKRTKEELKSRDDECEWLQKRVKLMLEADEKRKLQRSDEQSELNDLRAEIKNIREALKDAEIDSNNLKRQLTQLHNEKSELTQLVMSLNKSENDVQKKLIASKNEEEKLKQLIGVIQNDIWKEKNKKGLDVSHDDITGDTNIPAQLIHKITELTSEIARYSNEKKLIYDKLMKSREDCEKYLIRIRELEAMLIQKNHPQTSSGNQHQIDYEILAKKIHKKYMRVDSKRKALAYQKRYLLCVIGGYQISESNTLSALAQLNNFERSRITEVTCNSTRKCPKARFRKAAFAIISIRRMKWMVQRWQTKMRKSCPNFILEDPQPSFPYQYPTNNSHSSPQSRERFHNNPLENGVNGNNIDYEYYIQRFLDIQQRLGLALNEPESNALPSSE